MADKMIITMTTTGRKVIHPSGVVEFKTDTELEALGVTLQKEIDELENQKATLSADVVEIRRL